MREPKDSQKGKSPNQLVQARAHDPNLHGILLPTNVDGYL